jgi:alanine racemase
VVTHIPEDVKENNFFVVENTTRFTRNLQPIIEAFKFSIIGITGSNGKTIVKEWLNFY